MLELSNKSEIQKSISQKIKKYNGYMFLDSAEPVKNLDFYIGKAMKTITADDLAMVHITTLFPDETILNNKDGKKIFEGIDEYTGKKYKYCHPRITVHCTLNGLVQGNSGGNWDEFPYIVIDKFNKHLNQMVNIYGGDTYTNCSLNLSDEALYLISKDHIDSIPAAQLKNKNIIVFEGDRNIVVNETLIMMGYKPQSIDGWGWCKFKDPNGDILGETESTLTEKFCQNYINHNPNVTNMPHSYDMYRQVELNIVTRDKILSEYRNGGLIDSNNNLYPTLNEVISFYLEFCDKKESFDEFCSRYFIRYDSKKNQIFYLNSGDCYKNAHFDKKEIKVKFNKIDVLNTLIQNLTNIDDCYILFKTFNQNNKMIIDRVKTILQTLDLTTCLEKISNFKDYEEELLFSIRDKIGLLSLNEYQILKTQYPIYSNFFSNVFIDNSKISFHNINFNINPDGELVLNDKRISDANYDKLVQYLSQNYGKNFYLTKDGGIRISDLTENNAIINELYNIIKKFVLDNYDIFKDNNIISENEIFDKFKENLDSSLEQLRNNKISLNLFEDILLNCKLIEKNKNTKFDLYEILNSFIKVAINNPTLNNIQTIKSILERYPFDVNSKDNIYNIINNDLELKDDKTNIAIKQIEIKKSNELKDNITIINQIEKEIRLSTQAFESETINKIGK